MLLGEPPERASFSGRYGWQHCRTLFSLADSETSRLAESLARRRDLRGVALWGGGCVALRACGQVVCLDCPVDAKPRLERLVAGRAVIYYLSAGPQEQCYVQFSDGHTAWNAPDGFTDAVHACDTPVAAVAFGGWGTWTILFKDGSATWCGIPPALQQLLPTPPGQRHSRKPPTACWLALSPDAQAWFVRYTDGTWRAQCSALPALQDALDALRAGGASVREVGIGEGGAFYLRYAE
mmetsp:Transcript_6209/g.16037  ORF Transcript_6209/g.16037 Transcript_6209/m.16037 type:complete len:237 (+) Transcript_6209:3-713(+)|eukprot:jgi/Tetstr1/439466/TSEL_027899.t1